jgi:hypothetical protein
MKKAAVVLFALLVSGLVSGCASNLMMTRAAQEPASVPRGKSEIVFMRSSFVGSAIQASLYDVTSGKLEFLGIISNSTKISRVVDPGERVFMVVSESADFMKADMSANKTYYAMVTARMGVFRARFSLHPVRNQSGDEFNWTSREFANWEGTTRYVENTDLSRQWFEENRTDIVNKQNSYWPEWQAKPAPARALQTLNAWDGK